MELVRDKNLQDYDVQRDVNSVLLLRDMHVCPDSYQRQKIFEQVCNQEFSHISEVIPGAISREDVFDVLDGKLYVIQPEGATDWQKMHENGVSRAVTFAYDNPGFDFYADISRAELKEAHIQEEMVKAGKESTLVTISLCGDDVADDYKLSKLGRDPFKRRAFLRTSYFDGQKLRLYTNSIDGLDINAARNIYKDYLGADIPQDCTSTDILSSPKQFEGDRRDLIDKITGPVRDSNYQFVLGQTDLLSAYMSRLQELARNYTYLPELADDTNNLRYDIMASFKRRYEGRWENIGGDISLSIENAGYTERALGTEFKGCDTIISSSINGLAETGYLNSVGNLLDSLVRKEFKSKFCPQCLPKPKSGKSVKAWRQGDRLGCTDCGHVVDVCTKRIIKQGKKQPKNFNFWLW